eukprot:746616-Hanusia_phi.AAC.2
MVWTLHSSSERCGVSVYRVNVHVKIPTLKKLQWDMVEEKSAAVQFVVANSDNIQALQVVSDPSRQKCF